MFMEDCADCSYNTPSSFSRGLIMDLSDLVNLPGTAVTDVTKMKYNEVYITIETSETSVPCRLCGKDIRTHHGCDKERKLRHLPVFGRPTFIIYKPLKGPCLRNYKNK